MITLVMYIGSFTKLGQLIAHWKGTIPFHYVVIKSNVKVTVTINIFYDNRVASPYYLLFCILDLYQTLPHDFPLEVKEPYLIWGH